MVAGSGPLPVVLRNHRNRSKPFDEPKDIVGNLSVKRNIYRKLYSIFLIFSKVSK